MSSRPGGRGGTITPWKKGQSGNPRGRMKGLTHWVRELQGKKKFSITLTMTDEDGEVTEISRSLELEQSAAQMAATQLWLKAVQGDIEAIREIHKIEHAHEERALRSEAEGDSEKKSQSVAMEIIGANGEVTPLNIGGE